MRFAFGVVAIMVVSASGGSFGAQSEGLPAFEFRGHHIGEPVQDKFPYWSLGHQDSAPYCSDEYPDNTMTCFSDRKLVEDDNRIGSAQIGFLMYEFYNRKLYRIRMAFSTDAHQEMRQMLLGKYGQPYTEYTKSAYTAVAKYENMVSEWKFREGVLTLEQWAGEVNTGFVEFDTYTVQPQSSSPDVIRQQQQGKKEF